MRVTAAISAGAVLLLSGLTAQALESSAKTASKLSADAVWSKIGDFCGISNWHPAVEKCELSADGKTRTLSLNGGGTIVEGAGCRRPFLYLLDRQQPLAGRQLHVDHQRCSRWRGLNDDMGRQI